MVDKHVFWQALIFTVIIFIIGLIFGYFLESYRADRIELDVMGSEINMLDEQIRGTIASSSNVSCDLAIKSTFAFADKVYGEALKLEKYDAASKLDKDALSIIHKRYDLLRMMLWQESIKVRKRCGGFHIIVYFFKYDSENVELRAEQSFYSRLLTDIKNKHPAEVLLVPIAANMDIASVDLAKASYGISKLPAILVDEREVVSSIITLDELEKIVFSK
jgi:hypothetical protein